MGSAAKRNEMIATQLQSRGIADEELLSAFAGVAREEFVRRQDRDVAYQDRPIGIGFGATISQPYIVAKMLESAALKPGMRVLELGTGCGYQTALLKELGCDVYTIEVVPELFHQANQRLTALGYGNIHFLLDDGHRGWREHAPYDAILLTAAPEKIPMELKSQLKLGGILVGPEGEEKNQWLLMIRRTATDYVTRKIFRVRFVPLIKTGPPSKP